MKNFDSRTYNVQDFREWDERGQLILTPKFQRRLVWSQHARSFLIDTIIRGKPIPKIFVRQIIDSSTNRSIREVVDGQQRISTILSFIKDGFTISKVHNKEYGGLLFSQLPHSAQSDFLKYELAADLLINLPDAEILDIFARLNSYTIVLNHQEKLNANYFGDFKQTAYSLGFEFVDFYTKNSIVTDAQVSRMVEAELTSELLTGILEGIQSRKVIEKFYEKYDEKIPNKERIITQFKKIMDIIGAIYQDSLKNSNFGRIQMFYSLFLALYDLFFNLPDSKYSAIKFDNNILPKIRTVLDTIDDLWNLKEIPQDSKAFFEATRRGTTDVKARLTRHHYLMKKLLSALK